MIYSQKKTLLLILVLFPLLISIFAYYSDKDDSWPLKIYFFNVGQGDSAFIEAPGGERIIIDGGPDKTIIKKLGLVLSFWDKKIDYVVLSHPHDDHLFGLVEVLRRYLVSEILTIKAKAGTGAENDFWNLVSDQRAEVVYPQAGQVLLLKNDCRLRFLYPEDNNLVAKDLNDASLVLIFSCPGMSVFFGGDSGRKIEEWLLTKDINSQTMVFKASHHGSNTANSREFLAKSGAGLFIISVGENNRYGHPKAEALSSARQLDMTIYRTDQDGDVAIFANNSEYIVKTGILK